MKTFIVIIMMAFALVGSAQDSVLVFHELAPMPSTPKDAPSCFVIDSNLFVIGGADSDGYYSKEVWKYSMPHNAWSRMGDFPQGVIYSAGGFSINDKGYVCGGLAQNMAAYNTLWEYNPVTDTWTQKANYPGLSIQPRTFFSYQHQGYMGMGTPGKCNDLWKYDPVADQWVQLDTLPAPGRYGSSTVVSDSFAYFFGGYYRFIYGHSCKEVWRFNLNSNHWEQLADMPGTERSFCQSWCVGQSIICGSGIYFDSIMTFHTDNYTYNPNLNIWKPIHFQGIVDTLAGGYTFMMGTTGYCFGGGIQINPYFLNTNRLFSFDVTPLLTTGISETRTDASISVLPNPVSALGILTISVPEDGEIRFADGLGRLLYTKSIHSGSNTINCDDLHTQEGIIFYSAQLRHGTANGKVVIVY